MSDHTPSPSVVREDRYTIRVNGHRVRATPDQEARITTMTPEQVAHFLRAMGATS